MVRTKVNKAFASGLLKFDLNLRIKPVIINASGITKDKHTGSLVLIKVK